MIKAFSKELFNKINGGNNFKFEEFKTYFNSFLMELLNGNTNPFENTPPFESKYLLHPNKILNKKSIFFDK